MTLALHSDVEDLIFLIQGLLQIKRCPIDVQDDLVQMHLTAFRLTSTQGVGVCLAEFAAPFPDRVVTHENSAGCE